MELLEMKKVLQNLDITATERQGFLRLYSRLQTENRCVENWGTLRSPDPKRLLHRNSLPSPSETQARQALSKLAVCKLNGGLGTSMGCDSPKSLITVREGKSFLDLIAGQMHFLQEKWNVTLPLLLMNSFHTDTATSEKVRGFRDSLTVKTFKQNRYPRLDFKTRQPIDVKVFGEEAWYPPGHGDLYDCLFGQGHLDQLLEEGREILFVSNADNLGATVDPAIVSYMLDNDAPFLMETTPKTSADIKGGTLVEDPTGHLSLLEFAQVPEEHVEAFCDTKKFRIFNTNNIWIHLKHLKKRLGQGPLDLALILNQKTLGTTMVLQLETAIGAGLEHFDNAVGLVVDRLRFLPVKNTSDLMLIQSDLFTLENGCLVRNPSRKSPFLPEIKWDAPFTDIEEYHQRIPVTPSLLGLDRLIVEGDVRFRGSVALEGVVELRGVDSPLEIAAESKLENVVLGT